MEATHDSPLAGHLGFLETYGNIRERFFWIGSKADVLRHVRECNICQHNKVDHTHSAGLLHPFLIPNKKWESMSMDFITGLPMVQGKDCIYVVVEQLTKFAHLFDVTSTISVSQIVELFFK